MTISSTAKVSAPQLPSFAVLRERLVRRLDEAVESHVTLVVAPPGYGKSVLLAQWAAGGQERRRAWLELDSRDNNATQFVRSLLTSLQQVYPEVGESAAELVHTAGESPGDDFVFALIDDLAVVPETILVFDNFEALRNGALLADIEALIEHAPPNIHFVLVSRSDAAVGLHRLRVRGELAEIRQQDLAMDDSDAAELLRRVARVELDDDDVRVLVRRTEGWPAGLQLAALSLRGESDPHAFVRSFSGDDLHVADYLTDEVLSRQPDDVRQFLIETSVLERMNGPLCDAVTGRSGSQRMLESLDRRGLLMIRLDSTRTWFRYHPLLRDMLRYELRASEPERRRELMQRASTWHADHNDLNTAGQYLVATEDWDAVLDFFVRNGRALFEDGDASLLVDWMAAMPDELRRTRTEVGLTWAFLHGMTGRALAADEELSQLEERPLTPWQEATVAALRSTLVDWHLTPDRSLEAGGRAFDCLDAIAPDDARVDVLGLTSVAHVRFLARGSMGRASMFLGDFEAARRDLTANAANAEGMYRVWLMQALGAMAYLDAYEGEARMATSLASRTVDIAFTSSLVSHPASADAQLALASVARDHNELDKAAIALDEALHRIRRNRRLALLSVHTVEAALLALAQGAPTDAVAFVERSRTDGRPPAPPLPAARLVAVEARAHLAAGNLDRAREVLAAHKGLHVGDVVVAEIAVAVAGADVEAARAALAELPDEHGCRGRVRASMWAAIVDDLEGDAPAARERIAKAAAEAEPEGLVREFLDAGPAALRLLRAQYHAEPTAFVRSVVEQEMAPATSLTRVRGIVEQLSDREVIVLRYLPSRLSNPEIARHLFVSVNTLKTHLKHIYRKLEVTNRSDAIARAESLGLL